MAGFDYKFARLQKAAQDRQCNRCGLTISINYPECPHCHHLSDSGVIKLREQQATEKVAAESLGSGFIIYACIVAVIVVATLVTAQLM